MSTYIDKDGKEYKYHEKFGGKGDLVIVSNDGEAFALDSVYFRAASSVFREMLDDIGRSPISKDPSGQYHLSIPHSSGSWYIFLSALKDLIIDIKPDQLAQVQDAVEIGDSFMVGSINHRILAYLLPIVPQVESKDLWEVFALAARYKQSDLACRVLTQAWRVAPTEKSLDPTGWNAAMSQRVPGDWVWALSTACSETKKAEDHHDSQEAREQYWLDVVGRFLRNLLSV